MAHYEGGIPEMATPGSLPPGVVVPSLGIVISVIASVTRRGTATSVFLLQTPTSLLILLILTPLSRSLLSLFYL